MDIKGYALWPSKHFALGWMRKWNYDLYSLEKALENAYKVEAIGKDKYEIYVRVKNKSRKFICIKDETEKTILIITGAEGT